MTLVGVAMTKLLPSPHSHAVNNHHPLIGNHMPNFFLDGPLISFWQPKQSPMGVAMTKPLTLTELHVDNNDQPIAWRTHP